MGESSNQQVVKWNLFETCHMEMEYKNQTDNLINIKYEISI